ncbi:MAG: transposase, partial [Candidatus Poribacteria bacterium]
HNLYPLSALAELYGLRWQVELDIRHLKTTMGMEHLLSKTPQMVKKEFYIHLLAYNLIRQLQCEAGREYGILPITLSFKATIQHLSNFLFLLAMTTAQQRRQIYQQLITLIAHEKLMIRPNRIEPRVVKRRPKNYQRMNGSRKQLKQKCLSRKINPKTGKSSPSY